jgi:hypothetical protein
MPLHSILTTILAEYPEVKIEPFGGNPLANFLRHQAANEVQNVLGDLGAGLTERWRWQLGGGALDFCI